MAMIGYARTSTTGQNLDAQVSALKAFGCDPIRSEQKSGTTTHGRDELRIILDFVGSGDTLVVTRIDRLARSLKDLQVIADELKRKGAFLAATEQPVDTSTAAGKAFFDMLGVFAEFETNLRRERQAEGVAEAKKRGVYRGGKERIDKSAIRDALNSGLTPTQVSRKFKCSRTTVYAARSARSVKSETQ